MTDAVGVCSVSVTKLRYWNDSCLVHGYHCPMTSLCLDRDQSWMWRKKEEKRKEKKVQKKKNFSQRRTGRRETQEETNQGGSRDRCSPQGEPPLTRLAHKLFCSFRLHSKVVELGYKIISQATCLSSLAVQLANWREWFPVWATIQNMAVKIGMI